MEVVSIRNTGPDKVWIKIRHSVSLDSPDLVAVHVKLEATLIAIR